MSRVVVKKSTEELSDWLNGLREYLGLAPIANPHNERAPRRRLVEEEARRFVSSYPEPGYSPRTPSRTSSY